MLAPPGGLLPARTSGCSRYCSPSASALTDLSVLSALNAYAVLRRKQVVFTKAALEALAEEVKK